VPTNSNTPTNLVEELQLEFQDWKASQDSESPQSVARGLRLLSSLYKETKCSSLVMLLPFFLRLEGKPFNLANHFPLEPLYKYRDVPMDQIMMCGRQVSKSTTLAALGVINGGYQPYLNQLFVTPLFEQIRRFSNNYVRPFIENSPIKSILVGEGFRRDSSVFQRTFANESNMFFTFAFLDAERARGIAADILNIDELQDIDVEFIPILESCLAASHIGMTQYSGTPKTTDNAMHFKWEQSSQAHWVTKCTSCSDDNIAGIAFGLEKMIRKEGFCCKKCGALLNPAAGFYYHMYKDRANNNPGWHIPQTIMPMHYGNPRKWLQLYNKSIRWPKFRFYNEVLGEACDVGSRLVSRTQLMKVANLPWGMNLDQALNARFSRPYASICVGVDWGGGAGGTVKKRRNQLIVEGGSTSFTVISIVGFAPNSYLPELIYSERLAIDLAPTREGERIIELYHKFQANMLAHDYGGAGFLRETMLIQAGFPVDRIMPCTYTHQPRRSIIEWHGPSETNPRSYYALDKSRSLQLMCAVINSDQIRFPQWPAGNDDGTPVLYEDFLSLIENRKERDVGSDMVLISKNPKQPDDFCHSLNLACTAGWYTSQVYPLLASKYGISMGSEFELSQEPRDQVISEW